LNEILATLRRYRFVFWLLIAFFAGCLCTGFLVFGFRSAISGKLDSRYHSQHGRATEIIGRLETELEFQRGLYKQLREHNNRARELAEGLTSAADRNVRNLSDAVQLIGEIRAKVKILADFYAGSDSGDGGD
jgi:hypothetical protein